MDWSTILSSGLTTLQTDVVAGVTAIIPVALVIIGIGVVWKIVRRFIKSS